MIDVTSSKYLHKYSSSHQKSAATKAALYLSSAFVNDMSRGNPDVIDRRSRGLQRPWDSQGRHVSILNKPEQLRGPLSPYCKAGTQSGEARVPLQLVTAWMPDGMRRYLCVLDVQDSCCPLYLSPASSGPSSAKSPPQTTTTRTVPNPGETGDTSTPGCLSTL